MDAQNLVDPFAEARSVQRREASAGAIDQSVAAMGGGRWDTLFDRCGSLGDAAQQMKYTKRGGATGCPEGNVQLQWLL